MQKLPLALLNGSRGYGRAKDAEFRVTVDIVGFFALGFLPDGGRVFHGLSLISDDEYRMGRGVKAQQAF